MKNHQLTISEFQTLVLIYAAHADYKYDISEEEFIKRHSSQEDYYKMLELFNSTSEYNILKIVLEHKRKYYTDERKKQALYKLITEVFKADGDYSRPERVFLRFLDKMITN